MPGSGNRLLGRVAGPMLLVVLFCPWAPGQWDSRTAGKLTAINARPAAVALAATLESLSVTAAPATVPVQGSAINGARTWAITTAWAIPANTTTLRLSGYFDPDDASNPRSISVWEGLFRQGGTPFADFPGFREDNSAPAAAAGETMLVTQPMGATSLPGHRTDQVAIAIVQNDKQQSEAEESAFTIVVEAL